MTLLSDAGLVLENQAQALAGMYGSSRPRARTEPPEKRLAPPCRVVLSRLLFGEAETAHAAHGGGMIADAEAARRELGEIFQRVGRDAVDVRVGAGCVAAPSSSS